MNTQNRSNLGELGFDLPAVPGMAEADILTPALIIDLDAFEDNVARFRSLCAGNGVDHRAHAKMHKSVDVARYQIEHGGAVGICCQKVSEAEVFVRGGVRDILVSNQVAMPQKIDRLAALAREARILVCADDRSNVEALSAAAVRHGVTLEVLVEMDVGAGRCGVATEREVVALAGMIASAAGLKFGGLQAYQGAAQHIRPYEARKDAAGKAASSARQAVRALQAAGLHPPIVGGAGTGTAEFDAGSGVYTELQAGSYAFMDVDYAAIGDEEGLPFSAYRHSLFLLTAVMSVAVKGKAICDAGLKSQSVDAGLPAIWEHRDLTVAACNDEHLIVVDPGDRLRLNDRLRLVPGHCDPTCNVHDWYVGVRNGVVETLWPVSARGRML